MRTYFNDYDENSHCQIHEAEIYIAHHIMLD
jgi:hypothetical protein